MRTMLLKNRLKLWVIGVVLLLVSGCKIGNTYILVEKGLNSQESAIAEAQKYQSRRLTSQVFLTRDKRYMVTIGPFNNKETAIAELNAKKDANIIPPGSQLAGPESRLWTQVWPNQPIQPPGTKPPAPGPGTPPKEGVRDEVKKDADKGMKDDFVVYPEKP